MNLANRLQLVFLVFLVCAVIIRLFYGPPPPRGAIIFSDLGIRDLRQQAFQVSGPLNIVINAVGSVDQRQGANGLAAYAWITDSATGKMVWIMNSSNVVLDGSLATVTGEELVLETGTYLLNYSSFGQLHDHPWSSPRKDRRKWQVVLYSPGDQSALRPITRPLTINSDDQVWEATSLRGEERREYLFEVQRSTEFEIYAIGQLGALGETQPVDYSRIENAVNGQIVWQLTQENSDWAGGIQENRIFHDRFSIPPGIYRAASVTNEKHHFNDWMGNPPYDPNGWGLRLHVSDSESVFQFDPWIHREPIIAFSQVGDDELHEQTFTITAPTAVVLYSLGEITDPNNKYDFAYLEQRDSSEEFVLLWEMTHGASVHAGGARKNRKEVEFHRLDPGVYRLTYESDGSHSYEYWNSAEPTYPERWGVAMFSVQNQNSDIVIGIPSEAVAPTLQ